MNCIRRFVCFCVLCFLCQPVLAAEGATLTPVRRLDQSAIVFKGVNGELGVAQKNGKPYDGLKLSQHDSDIVSPNLAVGSDGTIHVAFTERHEISPFAYSVYHRLSADGGKTWSAAKNLSEDMPGFVVGNCKLLAD